MSGGVWRSAGLPAARDLRIERLTPGDLFMLWADDYGWTEDLGVVAVLDGTDWQGGDSGAQLAALRDALDSRMHLVPRFRQNLVRPRLGRGWPYWEDAPSFDIADHVGIWPLPQPVDDERMLAACAVLFRRPMDTSRPRWEAWLLPGLSGERAALLLRVHHTIADGVSGMATFASLIDPVGTETSGHPERQQDVPPWTPARSPSDRDLIRDNVARRRAGMRRAAQSITSPGRPPAGSSVVLREFFQGMAPRTSLTVPSDRAAGSRSCAVRWRGRDTRPTPMERPSTMSS